MLKPYLSRYRTAEEAFLDIDSIHTDRVLVSTITDSLGIDTLRVYSLFVGSELPNSLFNLCIEEYNDTLSSPYVLMYLLDSTFAEGYFEGGKTMDKFVGTVSKHDLETMFGYNTRIPDPVLLKRCLLLVFGPANTTIFGGSGGGGGSGSWNPPPPGTGVIVEQNGSKPGGGTSGGGEPCWGIIVDPINPRNWAILIDSDCDGVSDQIIKPRPQVLWDGSLEETKDSRDEFDDCINLLIMCGIIDERPRLEDGGTPPDPEEKPLTFGNMLAEQLGFPMDGSIADCIDASSKAVQRLLQQLMVPGALIDPGNPNRTAAEMLHDVVAAGCVNGGELTV